MTKKIFSFILVAFSLIPIASNAQGVFSQLFSIEEQSSAVPFPITGSVKIYDRNNREVGIVSYTATIKLTESEQIFSTIKVHLKNKTDKDVEGYVYAVVNGKRTGSEKFEIVPQGVQELTIYGVRGEVKQILVEPLRVK